MITLSDYYKHNDYLDEDIEFVYWGEDEDHSTVDEQKFKRKKSDKIDIVLQAQQNDICSKGDV